MHEPGKDWDEVLYPVQVPSGRRRVRCSATSIEPRWVGCSLTEVDPIVTRQKAEADEFHAAIQPPRATPDERNIQRQALSGMLWSKQIYSWDVNL